MPHGSRQIQPAPCEPVHSAATTGRACRLAIARQGAATGVSFCQRPAWLEPLAPTSTP